MRLIFLGSGEFGLPTLERLVERHEVVAVISQPDRPAGRHRRLTPTPIAGWARERGLHVITTDNVSDPDMVAQVRALEPDAGVVIAFGQKLSPELVEALGRLAINLHASLLPKFRGAAPINWAIITGEEQTGVSVIGLAQKMDAGLIYAQAATPIDPLETAGELHDRLAAMGPDLIQRVLDDLTHDRLNPQVQDETQATRAPKLRKEDGRVDFAQPADAVRRRIHGLTPWPGVRVTWKQSSGNVRELILRRVASHDDRTSDAPPGAVLDHHRVATARGVIELLEVQLPGGKPMRIDEFTRGHPINPGDVLTS